MRNGPAERPYISDKHMSVVAKTCAQLTSIFFMSLKLTLGRVVGNLSSTRLYPFLSLRLTLGRVIGDCCSVPHLKGKFWQNVYLGRIMTQMFLRKLHLFVQLCCRLSKVSDRVAWLNWYSLHLLFTGSLDREVWLAVRGSTRSGFISISIISSSAEWGA